MKNDIEKRYAAQKTWEQFNKLFKKGEQVFVGFKHGETHGFIRTVTPFGFGLVQLNNKKEIFYSWDKFNLIATPGVRIRKTGEKEEGMLWSLLPASRYKPDSMGFESVPDSVINNFKTKDNVSFLDWFVANEGLHGLLTTEIKRCNEKLHVRIVDNIKTSISLEIDYIGLEFLSKNEICMIEKRNIYCADLYTFDRRDSFDERTSQVLRRTDFDIDNDDYRPVFEKDFFNDIKTGKIKFKDRVYSSDPWSIEDITNIEKMGMVIHTKQGVVMTKFGSDMWL